MQKNPAAVTGATVGVIVLALIIIVYQVMGGGGGSIQVGQAYFSSDDGATFFLDKATNIPPFQASDGKPAYRAHVYSCDGGKTKFVGYLERLSPAAKARQEEVSKNPDAAQNATDDPISDGTFVKAPKTGNEDAKWVKRSSPAGLKIITTEIKCPGGAGNPTEVTAP